MFNLRGLARAAVQAVNPDQEVIILAAFGYAVNGNYEQRPVYAPARETPAQVQPVPDKTLQLLNQQRQNAVWKDFYLAGQWSGLSRPKGKGGDLLYWDGGEWLVEQVLEQWPDWTKARCVLRRQVAPPELGATEPPA